MKTKEAKTFKLAKRVSKDEVEYQSHKIQAIPYIDDILNAMSIPVIILNESRQIVYFNSDFTSLIGSQDDIFIKGLRPGEALNCVHALKNQGGCGTSDYCKVCGAVNAILLSLDGTQSVRECRITNTRGDALDLRVKATPLDIAGETFMIFAIQDISDEKRRRILERIFFHDLMNIVGCIYTSTKMLKNLKPEKYGEYMESLTRIITEASESLIEEIEEQRVIAEVENNDMAVNVEKVDSNEILEKLVSLFRNHKVCRGKHLEISPDSSPVTFNTDRVLLKRVLVNLVKNALEAIQPGETTKIGCNRNGENVSFRVHNPGVIEECAQLQIFQRSFTTKGTGRGLGTYSIKILTERYLKGKVEFTSSREKGTEFIVTYPLVLNGEAKK